jgi:hypothetical protein
MMSDNRKFNIANRPMAAALGMTKPERQRSYPNQRSDRPKPLCHPLVTTTTAPNSTNKSTSAHPVSIKTT